MLTMARVAVAKMDGAGSGKEDDDDDCYGYDEESKNTMTVVLRMVTTMVVWRLIFIKKIPNDRRLG